MVSRFVAASAALLAALGAASCAALVGLDQDFERGTGATGGAGGGGAAGTGGTTTTGPACQPVHPPDNPGGTDSGDIEFVTAMRKIDLDEKSPDVTLGMDIDGLCTCLEGAPPMCTPIADLVCDGPNGIDNALGIIFAAVYDLSSGAITSGQLSAAAGKGQWTNLVRVRGYNGEANDPKVSVQVYMTQGVNAGMPTPVWDGNDAWPVDDTSLAAPPDLDSALISTEDAYVADNVIVVHIPSEQLRIRGTLFEMNLDLRDVTFRANLEPGTAAGQYKFTNGVVSGKWALVDAFKGLSSIRYASGNKLCIGDDNYLAVKSTICGNADIRIESGEGTCDALSFGATFASDPAKLGMVVPAAGPPSDPCDPGTDPTSDFCE
ncbi:MAG: hypothetical protein IPK82_34610 [Polyangiaceae bacterium]|nr:hypothetical protein [Polyangiaceae bacterium]